MVPDLGEVIAAWPFAASVAAAASARSVREVRRRTALNEALHELRRPLQALTLTVSGGREPVAGEVVVGAERLADAVRMAAAALERLEREVNGEAVAATRRPLPAKPLVEAALARWRGPAAAGGSSLRLLWRAGDPVLVADAVELAQALDNLLLNAIEHGGARIELEARRAPGQLRLVVRDRGPRASEARRRSLGAATRLSGRRRHGHGLRVVRRVAAEHGGRFELRRSQAATEALLDLPLLGSEGRR